MSGTLREAVMLLTTLVVMALLVGAWVAVFAGIGVLVGP
jgi:hypothetical protein